MKLEQRIRIADAVAKTINEKISYAREPRFSARAWNGGEKVRIYWCNGFLEVDTDGNVIADRLKRAQKIDAAHLFIV